MNASRAAVMVVGANLLAVWAAAAAGGRMAPPLGRASEPPGVAAAQAVEDAQASLLAAAGRLEVHARRTVPAAASRDPFRFGGAFRRPVGPTAMGGPVETPAGAPAAAEPPEPDLVLQGLAESHDGEAVVRTAILRAGSELVLATLGTRIGGRYQVVAIGADSVELEDAVSRERRTCWMK